MHPSPAEIWAGYIGATCLGIIIGLVAAAVMADNEATRAQAKQVLRGWTPKIIRNKDSRK